MAAKFIAEDGLLKGLVLNLDLGQEWNIGRDPETCQILLEDPSVSRKHLLCRLTPDGILIENLSTTNPVEVNAQSLTAPYLLRDGDAVKIGSGIYRFYAEERVTVPPELPEHEHRDFASPLSHEEMEEEWDAPQDSIYEEETEKMEGEKKGTVTPVASTPEKHPSAPTGRPELEIPLSFDLLETGRWLLKVVGGPNQGAEFPMAGGTSYTIGTDPKTCDVVFYDTSVPRQHARISINDEDKIFIEDLNSRNGTLLEGIPLQGKKPLETNTLVTTGTTTFAVYDREGKMQTIISPLLPSIVKVLQEAEAKSALEEEARKRIEESAEKEKSLTALQRALKESEESKRSTNLGAFVLIAIVTGIFVIVGVGTMTLFQSVPIQEKKITDIDKEISRALATFTAVRYSYNEPTGRLFLVGHVMTANDKNELLYNLGTIPSIRNIDDSGVIIDELVWRETNTLMNKNPEWRGVSIQSPVAGQFILSGYLKTRRQAEALYDFVNSSFPYLDRLERQVVVEEDINNTVNNTLVQLGLLEIKAQFQNGDQVLTGGVPSGKQAVFQQIVADFKKIPGVRSVRTSVSQLPQEASMLNISERYEVTGFTKVGTNLSVVVNGRIVTRGDILDGMRVTDIGPHSILLEKDGVMYRIDY